MKRYWKLIAIVTVAVLTIGTFYIQSAISASNYPEVIIKKESGNEELIENITLNGSYFAGGNTSQPLTLTSEESNFRGERSFFERLRGMHSPEMNQLQDEYRGFMRGKGGVVSSYLDSENVLAYVDIVNQSFNQTPSEMEFEIAVLNKESGETTTFSLPVPNRALYSRAHVVDVQMVNGDLKVLTQNTLKPSEGEFISQEIHMYSFNVDEQEINGENEITIAKSKGTNVFSYINTMGEMDRMGLHNYMVFSTGMDNLGPEGKVEQSSQQYIAYNFAENKKEIIEIPEQLQNSRQYSFDGENLYAVAGQEKTSIIVYNLKSKKIENEIEVPSQSMNHPLISASDGKLYMLQTLETEFPELIVFDVKTGETLYKGKVTTKEPVKGDVFFNFYEMKVN
ncbi:hypothetical protein [Virgibacillus doumboii]|uniref:hypothetical protein n=1 Tax=Virgibacillus doumboii TaxID=2697503 RepID=UPI0013DF663B|nr:hypothetical protein [Virgibacillus doumboii]